MYLRTLLSAAAISAVSLAGTPAASQTKVAVTIKPLHSLVSMVTAGVSAPALILPDGASPHAYALRPSDMRKISNADLLVRIDPQFETFLKRATQSGKTGQEILNALHAPGLSLLPIRESGLWEGHDHGDHDGHDKHGDHKKHADHDKHDDHEKHADHDKHDDHEKHADHDKHDDHEKHADHDKHDDHEKHADHDKHDDHEKHAEHDKHHDHKEGETHSETDLHVWLHPENAIAIIRAVAAKLSHMDQGNAATYQANANGAINRLETLNQKLKTSLHDAENKKYFVFHDAYQYFETAYGLNAIGSISLNADRQPGVKRIQELRHKIEDAGDVICVFAEPQFNDRMVKTLVLGTDARTGTLDPIGVGIEPGPDAYPAIMNRLAGQIRDCLAPQ